VQSGERVHGGRPGKLIEAIDLLRKAAYRYLKEGVPFINPSLWEVFDRWQCSRRGIPPCSGTYDDMNPNLLAAFSVLDCEARRLEYEFEGEKLKALAQIMARR
jgi:hypothetical protein